MSIRAGRVALVTGASRGLGAAVARALASEGAHVALAARDASTLAAVASCIESAGGVALPIACDVADLSAVETTVREVEARLGPIEIVVNNAAVISPVGSLWSGDPDEVRRLMEVNYLGTWHVLRTVVPTMIERGHGRVVGVSSICGSISIPTLGHYSASKAAFEHLHRIAATEVDGRSVTVNWIWPGALDTDMQGQLREDAFAMVDVARDVHDAGLLRNPDDVAQRVLELCADDVDGHGTRLVVDLDMARGAGVVV